MTVSALLSRTIRVLCLSGMALGMTAAVAQETSVTLQGAKDGARWTESVVASSDPEGEVSNGIDPPIAANNLPEAEVDYDSGSTMDSDNFPESEVNNGLKPKVNP